MSDPRCAQIAARYSAAAAAYDRLWSPVIRPMSAPLFDSLRPMHPHVVLDVGCGTGALAADVRAVTPGAFIAGMDVAQGMVVAAAREGREHGVVAEANAIPFASGSVDIAFSVFVLQHVPDPLAAIGEMARAVRPGGAGATVTWGEGKDSRAEDVLEEMLDAAGAEKPEVALDTSELLNSTARATTAWESTGLHVDRAWEHRGEHRWTVDSLMAIATGYGRSKRRYDSLAPEAQASFEAATRARLAGMDGEELTWRPVVVFAIARR
ncbi:MAG: class I SAM-dependent methyltransferase [Actinomycetota bacterium]